MPMIATTTKSSINEKPLLFINIKFYEFKKKTGKSSLNYITEEVSKNNKESRLNKDFKDLIEKRVKIVHQKLVDQNNETKIIKDFKLLVEKRVKLTHNKLIQQKINR